MARFTALYDACVLYPAPLRDLDEALVCAAIRTQRLNLKKPPKPAEELLNTFEEQGLKQTAARLRPLVTSL